MNRPSYMDSNLNNRDSESTPNSSNPLYSIEPKPYKCMIKRVENNEEKSALIISFDIVEGQLSGVFTNDALKNNGEWNRKGKIWISYAEDKKDFFEGFITSVRKSNVNFIWDWNEQKLVGKNIVVLYGEEEFQTKDTREIKISIKPRLVRSYEALAKGEIIYPPAVKKLSRQTYGNRNYNSNNQSYNSNYKPSYEVPQYQERQNYNDVEVNDDDLPF